MMSSVRRALALGALAVVAVVSAMPGSAVARGSVSIGIGVAPVFPAFPDYGYYPPPRHFRPPPPVVLYAPPPPVVYYEPPPAVVYAPPPAAFPVDPAGLGYRAANGQQCREYQTTAMIAGRPQATFGTACLMSDGTWRIVN